jgi:hypothetical protein
MSLIHFPLFLLLFSFTLPLHAIWPFTRAQRPFSIMLDPAGDAKNTGRVIEDSFERGITLQFAEQLKKVLEELYPGIRIVLTRFPGETIERLQNANFANRLDVDLYVSIHFYHEKSSKPNLYLYHFLYNPITDFWSKPRALSFYPYDQAHLYSLNKTVLWGEQIKTFLKADAFRNLFEVKGLYGVPLRPLIGIKAPALAIEAGIKNKGYWRTYVEPIAQSLIHLIREAA